jgi:hypothetical protein
MDLVLYLVLQEFHVYHEYYFGVLKKINKNTIINNQEEKELKM